MDKVDKHDYNYSYSIFPIMRDRVFGYYLKNKKPNTSAYQNHKDFEPFHKHMTLSSNTYLNNSIHKSSPSLEGMLLEKKYYEKNYNAIKNIHKKANEDFELLAKKNE